MSFIDVLAFKKSSSRSVSAIISEGCRKRQYPKHFSSKLNDVNAENSETWLLFALKCNYVNQKLFDTLFLENVEVGKLINYIMNNPTKFAVN